MKKLAIALVVLAVGVVPASWAQGSGESPPQIYDVSFEIARYEGSPYITFYQWDFFFFDLYGAIPGLWADPVPFDPFSEVAYELDVIIVTLVVVDLDIAESEDDDDLTFFIRAHASGSIGPPEAPPLQGSTENFVEKPWASATPPPDSAAVITHNFLIESFLGANQDRLRGTQDWDVFYTVELRVANEENPKEGFFDETAFYIAARENPLLAVPNPPPFADAGPDQTVLVDEWTTLDGSRSFDSTNLGFDPNEPEVFQKDTLDFVWEWLSGPERVDPQDDGDASPATVRIRPTVTGTYVYRLLLEDGVNPIPSTDTVNITVVDTLPENRGPRAVITGPTDGFRVGDRITLSGADSSDPDGDELTYRWRQTNEIGGPLLPEEVIEQFQPLFGLESESATWRATAPGVFYFSLLVTDPDGLGDAALTSVTVASGETATLPIAIERPTLPGAEDADAPAPPPPATSPGLCGAGLAPAALLPLLMWPLRPRSRRG